MSKKTSLEKTLLIDIGTAFVTGGMVGVGKDHLPHLGVSERVPLATGTDTARESLSTILAPAVKTLAEKFMKETPRTVRVVLSAPWHDSRIRTINSHSEKPVPVSSRTVMRAVDDAKNHEPPAPGKTDIEAVAVHVTVNGYGTSLAHTVVGQELSINLYESEAEQATLMAIENELHRVFTHATISFHTFPLVSMVALRGLTDETSFLVVDCAGEVTQVATVHRDSIEHFATFPIGYFAIARAFGGEVSDAMSRLTLLSRNELNADETATARAQYEKAVAEWKKALDETLAHASEVVPLPRTLFLISDREPMRWLTSISNDGAVRGLHVVPVTPSTVQPMVTIDTGATFDIFLSLAGIFFHIYERELIGE